MIWQDEPSKSTLIVIVVVAYLIVASVLALWLAGCLYFFLHSSLPQNVDLGTWVTYARFYWDHPRERSLLLISGLFSGLTAFMPGFVLSVRWGRGDRELHGSARFASAADVQRAGLMGDRGLIVGKFRGRFLHFAGQQFCLLAAPTRSGKGVSFVIPNLLNWPDSCVVLDIKLENYLLTSKFRARHGQKVFLFNPFAETFVTHRWNPMDGISRDPNFRVGDLLALASSLYPAQAGDKDAFWADSAKNLFLGLSLMVMESPDLPLTLGEILRQCGGKGRGLKEYLGERINARTEAGDPYSADCLDALNRFMSASENTLANIISSFTAPLTLFSNPIVDAATSASDFDIRKVRDERMTIYIGIQPNRLADASLLINVFFSQLINLNTRELPSQDKHSIQCLLILDEFTALGKIGILAKANAFIAGYNLRLLTIIQSLSQLEGVYGQADARTLITNHAMQVLFTPREQRDANAYSEMLGYATVKSRSLGRSTNRGFASGGSNSENLSDQRRALLLPQELKEMPDSEQIIVLENTRPIRAEKARYYQERGFMDRLKALSATLGQAAKLPSFGQLQQAAFVRRELASPVPTLDLDGHIARVQNRTRPLLANDLIDLNRLDLSTLSLPELDDPDHPSDASIRQTVDGFFESLGIDTQSISKRLFGPDPAKDTQNEPLLLED
ncbi:type IV secretory system conjugative DNA transfer family protein [Asticcacaulis sp. W401b]|uniref:type IV secretory system conjugative DNA transfer family protein n=1 Tax=Asticcacaulis sp. W401b TaxID=3388666 RepID=UPI003970D573